MQTLRLEVLDCFRADFIATVLIVVNRWGGFVHFCRIDLSRLGAGFVDFEGVGGLDRFARSLGGEGMF